MTLLQYLQAAAAAYTAYLGGKTSITFGEYTVSATNNGAPVKFTFASALAALEEVLLSGGTMLSFQIGSTLITVTKN